MALPSSLSSEDLAKFRTRFCERLLQYGECSFGDKCQYSHNLLWRRRSPQKFGYDPRLCPGAILWRDSNDKLQLSLCCPEGKSCKLAHSFEEVLYHPRVYKVATCDVHQCMTYYCPFAHNLAEQQHRGGHCEKPNDLIKRTIGDVEQRELFVDERADTNEPSIFSHHDEYATPPYSPSFSPNRRPFTSHIPNRLYIPALTPAETAEAAHWLQVSPGVRIESLARARSVSLGSDLCRALWTLKGERRQVVVKAMQLQISDPLVEAVMEEHYRMQQADESGFVIIRKLVAQEEGVFMVMDRCVTSLDGGLPEGLLKRMQPSVLAQRVGEIVRALVTLHSLGIPHMRISPSNILIDADANWKLGDCFGKFRILSSTGPLPPAVSIWQPPEVLGAACVDWFRCDIWSLGVTLIYAMTGRLAYHSVEDIVNEQIACVPELELLCETHPLLVDLILRMIQREPEDRPTAAELLQSPLFWDARVMKDFVVTLNRQKSTIVSSLLGGVSVFSKISSERDALRETDANAFWLIRAWDAWRLAQRFQGREGEFVEKYLRGFKRRDHAEGASKIENMREYYILLSAAFAGRELVELDTFFDKTLGSDQQLYNSAILSNDQHSNSMSVGYFSGQGGPWEYAVQCPPNWPSPVCYDSKLSAQPGSPVTARYWI